MSQGAMVHKGEGSRSHRTRGGAKGGREAVVRMQCEKKIAVRKNKTKRVSAERNLMVESFIL